MKATDPVERILALVFISRLGCWECSLKPNTKGYVQTVDSRACPPQIVSAHRVVYEHFHGPIPVGLQLDHLCRVHNCVNPDHLEPVTSKENLHRGDTHAARNAAKTHCPKQHEYTPANTYVYQGKRLCRECRRARYREWYRRRWGKKKEVVVP